MQQVLAMGTDGRPMEQNGSKKIMHVVYFRLYKVERKASPENILCKDICTCGKQQRKPSDQLS